MKTHPTQDRDRLRDAAARHTLHRHGITGDPGAVDESRLELWAAALDFAVWYEEWAPGMPETAAAIDAKRHYPAAERS